MNEIDELKAHVERLRKAMTDALAHLSMMNRTTLDKSKAVGVLLEVLFEIPAQSLNHIMAQVEEETIERCVEIIDDCDPNLTIWELRQLINNQKRKYKEKSDENN